MVTDNKETFSHWKNQADKYFSLYVRLRDSNENGYLNCFICGKWMHYKEAECLHFNVRQHMATRYDPECAHAGCSHCNNDPNHDNYYWEMMVSTYGLEKVEALKQRHNNEMKLMRVDLIYLCKEFKEKFETLKKQKNL